jgi:hypothetical protein
LVVPFLGPVVKRSIPPPLPVLGRGEGVRVNPRFLEDKKSVLWRVVKGTPQEIRAHWLTSDFMSLFLH